MEVLDLFCGVGNFSLPIARRGARVTGVDSVELAIEAARRNALAMGLEGSTQFIAATAADMARFLSRAKYRAATVILDPPRAGARNVAEALVRIRPNRIIYVSCDMATMARDVSIMVGHGYQLGVLRGFDLFPNTHHVEVVGEVLLT
jgi:23S rRNA (uracil1939-C5)-methyltransferase